LTQEFILENLPTGKPHISFSELKEWQECSYRHKLRHIEKIDLFQDSPIIDFGTAVHSSCENFLKTKEMNFELAINSIEESFEKKKDNPAYTQKAKMALLEESRKILLEVPLFLDETFPGWEFVDAEHYLYEKFNEVTPHAFKGFIDGIIKTKGKKGEDIFWIIDWKTTAWGWTSEKKSDFSFQQQLILYRNFWSRKIGCNSKSVKCGFVLLKRTAKDGSRCEFVKVSAGDITTNRSLKNLSNMFASLKRGIYLKNKESCTFCPYKGTEHCV
jgi:hypothetical protein